MNSQELKENLQFLNENEKLEYIIQLGKELLPIKEKKEKNKIRGCTSNAYIKLIKENNQLTIQGDADSIIVKGYIKIIQILTDKKTKEYLQNQLEKDILNLIKETKLDINMLPSRANAFSNMIQHIKKQAEKL
ncbi:SufE family protein [Candidatus Woesearchaeota archaeon]|nr:SufE family protein [Candidatus Woesearchaeota archaeon]